MYEDLDRLHDAVLHVECCQLPSDLPSAVKEQVDQLGQTAARWAAEIRAAMQQLEASEARAELLANGIDPDYESAVDRFFEAKC